MKPPKAVLAATDFSACARNAVRRAAMLAAQSGAPLTLVHVMSRPFLGSLEGLFRSAAQARKALHESAKRMLEEQAEELVKRAGSSSRLQVRTKVRVGNVQDELLAACAASGLLVLGVQGDRTLRDLFLGSTAERLLRHAPIPVLVVRRPPHALYRKVLVPADFSPASTAAFDLVERFAPDAAVTVVHAFDTPFEGKLRLAGVPTASIRAHRARAHREALDKLAALDTGTGLRHRPAIVQRDSPVRLILETEKSRKADLIVIGRQGQSKVEEIVLGLAKCDVLVATRRSASA
jgi:nucleotide-binding universal stress UspA family protein